MLSCRCCVLLLFLSFSSFPWCFPRENSAIACVIPQPTLTTTATPSPLSAQQTPPTSARNACRGTIESQCMPAATEQAPLDRNGGSSPPLGVSSEEDASQIRDAVARMNVHAPHSYNPGGDSPQPEIGASIFYAADPQLGDHSKATHQPMSASKKTMSRLSRMFTQTGGRRDGKKDYASDREYASDTDSGHHVASSGGHPPVPQQEQRSASGTSTPADASRATSNGSLLMPPPQIPSAVPQAEMGDQASSGQATPSSAALKREPSLNGKEKSQRFTLHEDGSHSHLLRSARRQEKLSHMLRDLLGGRKKEDGANKTDNPDVSLSLIHNFADQIQLEKDKVAQLKEKGGPNATATLVEKYGKCQEIIGRGAFGIVRVSHKVDSTRNGAAEQLYAVKEFRKKPQESSKRYTKRLTSEFCISSSLRHPNVIHTLDLLQDAKGDYCEVMEFCAGGDLYTLILAAGKLEVVEADCYFKQLMRGVQYMHEMGVAHRDLKPENLLLTQRGALKITDFGNGECFRMAWEKEAHMTCGLCGSAPYIAPEEYVDKEFDPRAVDIWATGVIYMAMRTGRHLWRMAQREEDEFYERYLQGRRDEAGYEPIETLSRARCRNVIYSILDPNPPRRITAKQVFNSEWGREIQCCVAGESGV